MKGFFLVAGVVCIIASVPAVISSRYAVLFGLMVILFGLALIVLSNLMRKVEFLQKRLNLYEHEASDEELPQKTCSNCQGSYDFDYPKCPHCGYEGE